MPINPVRFTPMEFPENPRPVPIDFSAIGDIGRMYGQYRDRQEVGQLLKGAIDPKTGVLDWNKAATTLAVSGRDPEVYLRGATAQAGLREREAAQRALEAHYERTSVETERANRAREERQDRPTTAIVPPTLTSPGGVLATDPRTGTVTRQPYPAEPAVAPPPPVVRPQSALPGPSFAQAEPNPEMAPPYRVAGPPMPPPQQTPVTAPAAPATQPAPAPARNEDYLRRLPSAGQTIVKGVAEYEIDPSTIPADQRADVVAAAKNYRPDYSMAEYQKRGSPPSGEVAARIGLSRAFLEKAPAIRERLQANELNSWQGAATALWGQGGPGELRRAIDEGSEALLRGLTGAGMGITEAQNYARRYQFDLRDNKDTAVQKLNELENALRSVTTEVGKGRGGEDLLKDYRSQFGKPVAGGSREGFDERSLAQYKTTPTAALSRAQKLLDAGADRGRVRDLLNQVDPSLPAKLGL